MHMIDHFETRWVNEELRFVGRTDDSRSIVNVIKEETDNLSGGLGKSGRRFFHCQILSLLGTSAMSVLCSSFAFNFVIIYSFFNNSTYIFIFSSHLFQ